MWILLFDIDFGVIIFHCMIYAISSRVPGIGILNCSAISGLFALGAFSPAFLHVVRFNRWLFTRLSLCELNLFLSVFLHIPKILELRFRIINQFELYHGSIFFLFAILTFHLAEFILDLIIIAIWIIWILRVWFLFLHLFLCIFHLLATGSLLDVFGWHSILVYGS